MRITEINVAGRNTIASSAIDVAAELSRLLAVAIDMFHMASFSLM